ncbi:aldose 1-epimerase family protein [Terrarubrum flagellatum]|uniref:aldose epimerase family protein n=1 Tax=Terrirubrum flagellatum TaxID=2895980 RepID=UPI0031453535
MDETIHLRSRGSEASISLLGAELTRLAFEGREVLWRPEPAIWAGACPILFPVVAAVRGGVVRVDRREYAMPLHGFAGIRRFDFVAASQTNCELILRDDDDTRAHYPFAFRLGVNFALRPKALEITARIENPGEKPLPASLGFHPGFRWPLVEAAAKSDHVVLFPDDRTLAYTRPIERLVGPKRGILPLQDGRLPLSPTLFATGGVLLLGLNSRSVAFGPRDGEMIHVDFPSLPYLMLWSRPSAPFLCIEPLSAHADPVGFDGELAEKPGVTLISPGQSATFSMRIRSSFRGS